MIPRTEFQKDDTAGASSRQTRFARLRKSLDRGLSDGRGLVLLTAFLALATLLMFAVAYWATREWQRSALAAIQARARQVMALVSVALERDMKGAQYVGLFPLDQNALEVKSPNDLADFFAIAFARFPYVDSFVVWRNSGIAKNDTYVFSRAERPTMWAEASHSNGPAYPIMTSNDPPGVRTLIEHARNAAVRGARSSVFEDAIAGRRYQVVVHFVYEGGVDAQLYALVGLVVDLDWVRRHYFNGFIDDIQAIAGDKDISIAIIDGTGGLNAGMNADDAKALAASFPLVFADRSDTESMSTSQSNWLVRVGFDESQISLTGSRAAARIVILLAFAGSLAVVALALTVRADRAAARFVKLQSDFIATVTHEMKTPLALIRLAAETISKRRYTSSQIADYGQLLGVEANRLTLLIDNVLSYARMGAPNQSYAFELVDIPELLDESVRRLKMRIGERPVDVRVEASADLPSIRADRAYLLQVFDNLVDNAVKHGGTGGSVAVTATCDGNSVQVQISDLGPGIPSAELPHVFDKFYRGANARQRGTGLGLAVVRQVVEQHGGRVTIRSVVNEGTTVYVTLPAGPQLTSASAQL